MSPDQRANGVRLYTAEEVGDAQASEAELVSRPLRAKIRLLEAESARLKRDLIRAAYCCGRPAGVCLAVGWFDEAALNDGYRNHSEPRNDKQ